MSSRMPRMSAVDRLEVMTFCGYSSPNLSAAIPPTTVHVLRENFCLQRKQDSGALVSQCNSGLDRKMGNTEADRKKILINATIGIVRCPTSHVLKQTDGSNPPVCAEVEPVPGAARNTNQISGLDLYADYPTGLRVNMEQSVARDYESHLVFVVPVLAIKLRQHFLKPGSFRTNINHIRRYIAAASFQLVDIIGIRLKNLFRRCIESYRMSGYPLFVIYATRCEVFGNRCTISQSAVFIKYIDQSHRQPSLVFCVLLITSVWPSTSSRNSRISTCRLACGKSF